MLEDQKKKPVEDLKNTFSSYKPRYHRHHIGSFEDCLENLLSQTVKNSPDEIPESSRDLSLSPNASSKK